MLREPHLVLSAITSEISSRNSAKEIVPCAIEGSTHILSHQQLLLRTFPTLSFKFYQLCFGLFDAWSQDLASQARYQASIDTACFVCISLTKYFRYH